MNVLVSLARRRDDRIDVAMSASGPIADVLTAGSDVFRGRNGHVVLGGACLQITHFGPRNFLGEVGPDRGSLLGLVLTCIKNRLARHVNQQNGACKEISKW